jgi:hypothetical protein
VLARSCCMVGVIKRASQMEIDLSMSAGLGERAPARDKMALRMVAERVSMKDLQETWSASIPDISLS